MNQFVERSITPEELIAVAMNRLRAGDTTTAAGIFREMLGQAPDNAQLLYLSAVCEHQAGRFDEAEKFFRKAIERNDGEPGFHLGLGRNYKEQGRFEEATACYRAALGLAPESLDATVSLGVSLWRSGRAEEAVELLSRAQDRHPDSFEVAVNLGNARFHAGGHAEALDAYRRAAALRPNAADAHNNIGRALAALGRVEQARASFEEALRIAPAHAEALFNLGNILLGEGDLDGAAARFAGAIEKNASYADGYSALARVLYDAGFFDEALAYLDRFIALRPVDAKAHLWRGLILRDRGSLDEALEEFARARQLDPESAESYALTGSTYWSLGEHRKAADAAAEAYARDPKFPPVLNLQGNLALLECKLEESLRWYEEAVAADAGYQDANDNLLFVSNYSDRRDARQLFEMHRSWGTRQEIANAPRSPRVARSAGARLRIGLVSPDFNQHSVAHFLEPVLRHYDRERFEFFAYYNNRRIDVTTRRMGDMVQWWRPIAGMTDGAAARLVDEDRIDVLVDLAGHTAGNRLGVFALRPAPVQATWLGYPTTTGLPQMDYRISDPIVDRDADEALNIERLVRLPRSYFCFQPAQNAPAVAMLPALSEGAVTFGSFNNFAKVSDATLGLWSRVLLAVPGSRLVLKSRSLGNEEIRDRLLARLSSLGVDPGRILAMSWEAQSSSHLATYHKVDIALDTFPYNGATTTCEALWMGVPVVTLSGSTHASRMGASILRASDLESFIARDEENYVETAARLAGDLPGLQNLREGLREKLLGSALMDHAGYTKSFESALEEMARAA